MIKVSTLEDLWKAVEYHKAVVCPDSPCFNKPRPAAVIINLQGTLILRLFQLGMYIYEKKKRR